MKIIILIRIISFIIIGLLVCVMINAADKTIIKTTDKYTLYDKDKDGYYTIEPKKEKSKDKDKSGSDVYIVTQPLTPQDIFGAFM